MTILKSLTPICLPMLYITRCWVPILRPSVLVLAAVPWLLSLPAGPIAMTTVTMLPILIVTTVPQTSAQTIVGQDFTLSLCLGALLMRSS